MACEGCGAERSHRFVFEAKDHSYYLDDKRTAGVTTVLTRAGLTNYHDSPWNDYYLRRGAIVHQAISQIIRGTFDEGWLEHAEEWRGYIDAAKAWLRDSRFEVIYTEQPLYSCRHRYAGSPDLIGRLPLRGEPMPALPDFKLTKVQPACRIQTMAYVKALVSLGDMHCYVDADRPHLRFPVELRKDGSYRADKWYEDDEDERIWYSALALEHWRDKHFGNHRAA